MLEFFKDNWSEILSVIGAAAWLPFIFKIIINIFRRVNVSILDSRILIDATSFSVGRTEEIKGTILLLALNLFIKDLTLFARKISVRVKLENGMASTCEILDFSNITSHNTDGTESRFDVSVKDEFNISRTIHHNQDNIKYIAVLVKSATFSKIEEISEIEIKLFYLNTKCSLLSKKIKLKPADFPKFNPSHLLDTVERRV